jgi:CubicO group peptidase (beta-lactamase class C family)
MAGGASAGQRPLEGRDGLRRIHGGVVRSATKSITSLLMGIALDAKFVGSVNDPITEYFPQYASSGKGAIRIRDLLTMRSGLDADDNVASPLPGNENALDASNDLVNFVFSLPITATPETVYRYASVNAFLVGSIIANAGGVALDQFAARRLFGPLGITEFRWRHAPNDRVTGEGNLWITTRDLAALGQLVLDRGMVSGQQIVSSDWIEASLAPKVAIGKVDPYADSYGYMWYSRELKVGSHTIEIFFASGNGGNKIYLIPSLDMVVGITSSAYNTRYGQRRSQDALLQILAASN